MRPVAEAERRDAAEADRSVFEFVTVLARNWRLLAGFPLLVAASAVVVSVLLLPRRYTVESRFIPESNGPNVSRLAGLAAQFGVNIPGGETTESIDFYAELLESQDLLRDVVLTEFAVRDRGGDSIRGNLVELLDADGDTPAEREREAVEELAELVIARPDPGANMVTLRTSAEYPSLAVAINTRLLGLLNEFNLERRQSRAAAEREFLESRVEEAATDLRAAEERLERFLSENRRYNESPQLRFEEGRLQRVVALRQQLYTSLAQGFEQARVDEVRNTPVITIVDQPRGPARRTAPNIIVNGLLGLIFGLLLALGYIITREFFFAARQRNPAEFARLRAALRGSGSGKDAVA